MTKHEAATHRIVAPEGLITSLDRAAAGRVTIISAPAGSGKTSLLRAWASRPGLADHIAFVPVQRDEQDAQLFWLAVLDAVRPAAAADGMEPPPTTPDLDIQALADRVLAELAGIKGRLML